MRRIAKGMHGLQKKRPFLREHKRKVEIEMNIHSLGDLQQMQALPLQVKIKMTKERIWKWHEYWDGNVYVSFSGGKDSTVLLHIARSLYPDVEAVFSDTGLEYPEVRSFAMKQENVTVIQPKMNFKQVITKYGYPIPSKEIAEKIYYARKGSAWALKLVDGTAVGPNGRPSRYAVSKRWRKLLDAPFKTSHYCCHVLKKQPFKYFERKTGRKPILGTMAFESKLREQEWMRTGCNAFDGRQKSTPMAFWTENDVLEYIKENNIEIASIYGDIIQIGEKTNILNIPTPVYKTTGCSRTGCMFCMFGCHLEKEPNRFQRMKETHPKQYEWCMKPISEGGLGLDEVLKYAEIPH